MADDGDSNVFTASEECFVEKYATTQLMWKLSMQIKSETNHPKASILSSLLKDTVKQTLEQASIEGAPIRELAVEGERRGTEIYLELCNNEEAENYSTENEDFQSIDTDGNAENHSSAELLVSTSQDEISYMSHMQETSSLPPSDFRPPAQCAPLQIPTSSSAPDGGGQGGSVEPKTIDLVRNPLSLTGPAAKKALEQPLQTQSLNNAFLRRLRSELDLRGGLIAGMVDIASVFMLYWVHVLLGKASPSDFEKNGKLCVDVLQDTMPIIAEASEAKRAAEERKKADSSNCPSNLGDYLTFDISMPLGTVMNSLEKTLENNKSDPVEQTDVARNADAAYTQANLRGKWYNHTKLGNSTMCFFFVMGQANASFRVLQLITLKQFLGSIGRGMNDKSNKKLLLNLCTIFLKDFESIDKSSYTMLMVYEHVLVPAVLGDGTSLDGIAALDFVCTQIIRKKYKREWAITQQIPMNKTLDDMGGKETMIKWIDSQDPENLEKYLTDEDTTNCRKRRASRMLSYPLAATCATSVNDPSGFLYSFLCGPASIYLSRYDIVVDPDFLSRQIDEELAKELKTLGSSIVSTRTKRERGFQIPLYVDNSSPCSDDIDPEDARNEKIELYEAFFAICISTPQVEVDNIPSLPPLPVFDTVEAV